MPNLTSTKSPGQPKSAKTAVPADRLPRAGRPNDRGHEIRIGLLGTIGLLLLVVGIPAALILFVGYPLPRSAPSHSWLTTSLNARLLINVLACVVWVVWAHFAICIVAEWRAIRHGRLPGSVPLGGGSQFLARRLVAAVLLLAGAAAVVPHGGGHAQAHATATSTRATSVATATVNRPTSGSPTAVVQATQPQSAAKYYVVQPPDGRRYDSLWDISARTLGNPLRYHEIYELNKDRVQTDGRSLIDANLIRPGWQLILPADATGPGVESVQAAPTPTPAAAPAAGSAVHTGTTRSVVPNAAGTIAATHTEAASGGSNDLEIAVGGGLMLAGLALALSTRRGPYVSPDEQELSLGAAGDPELAHLLDRELRRLAAWRTAQRRPLPHPLLAYVSPDRIVLQLAGGDASDPPTPWQLGDDGRSWTLTPDAAAGVPVGASAPFPGLVAVGRSHGFELFVDLEQAPGLIAIGGDLERAREAVTSMAVQAATSIWSDGVRVSLIGFGDGADLAQIDPELMSHSPHLDPVLDSFEAEHADLLALAQASGVDGVLTGRQLRQDADWRPRLVVLSGPPTSEQAIRLQALTGNRSNLVVLVVGSSQDARWRFAITSNGRLDLGPLGASADAHLFTRAAGAQIVATLRASAQRRCDQNAAVATLAPQQAVVLDPVGPPPDPAAPVAVQIRLLGPVEVQAAGALDSARRDLATEIVVAAALHPNGLHDAVLRASIWPRGVSDDVATAAMADVSRWLGDTPDGHPRIWPGDDGQWRLSADVRSDWTTVQQLAASATGRTELATLSQAVALFEGEGFSGTPTGRYNWLAFGRAARDARVAVTVISRRAAALLVEQGRRSEAIDVLGRGLVVVPTAELMWRDLLTITGTDGPTAASSVADRMYAALAAHHARPEPETDALVAQLAPGYRRTREIAGEEPSTAGTRTA